MPTVCSSENTLHYISWCSIVILHFGGVGVGGRITYKAQEILKVTLSKENLQEAQDVCIWDRFDGATRQPATVEHHHVHFRHRE